MKHVVVAAALLIGQFSALVADAKSSKYHPRADDQQMSASHPGAASSRLFYPGGRASWGQIEQNAEPERGTSANGQ